MIRLRLKESASIKLGLGLKSQAEADSGSTSSQVLRARQNEAGKKGEGSRGGQVIGHTKSGKAIYASGNKGEKGWSKQDHKDAYSAHAKVRNDASDKIDSSRDKLIQDHKNNGTTIEQLHSDATSAAIKGNPGPVKIANDQNDLMNYHRDKM